MKDVEGKVGKRLLVPEGLRKFVMQHFHGLPLVGHNGQKKTTQMIAQRFYWPKLRSDVRRWIGGCKCTKRKALQLSRQGMMGSLTAPYPFHTVSLDFVTGLPVTDSGNANLLTAMDICSKWPMAYPQKTKGFKESAQNIYRRMICQHGCPKRFLTDIDGAFTSGLAKDLAKRMGILKVETTRWHPAGNGVLERWHRYMNATLTQFINKKKNNWDDCIDAVLFAYRISVQESTQVSPFKFLYGRDPILPMDILLGLDDDSGARTRDGHWGNTVMTNLKEIWKEARQSQLKSIARNQEWLEARQTKGFLRYETGDWVMMWDPEKPKKIPGGGGKYYKMPAKFQEKWTGPYRISTQATDVNYMLAVPDKKKKGGSMRVHIDIIRPYFPWDDDLTDTSPMLDIDGQPFALTGNPGEQMDPLGLPEAEPAVREPVRAKPVFRRTALPREGHIFIMHLPGQPEPEQDWGVAKMITQDANGYLIFQWLGNTKGDWTRPVQPEWAKMGVDPVSGEPRVLHIKHARYEPAGYIPYTCDHTQTGTKLADVLMTGVILEQGRIHAETIQRISDSARVRWELPEL
jgi:hypothetical protein